MDIATVLGVNVSYSKHYITFSCWTL